jgi:hypothetical protein
MFSFMAGLVICGVLAMLTIATLRHLAMIAIRQTQRDKQLDAEFAAWRDGPATHVAPPEYAERFSLDDPDKR